MDPLVTVEELASYLQSGTVDRATAELVVAGASGMVRAYCGWIISREETTFTLDGSGHTLLALPTLNLVEVTEVRIDGIVIDAYDPEAASEWQYRWSAAGVLDRPVGWPRRFRCVEADVVHGYDPVPDLVKLVTLARAGCDYDNPERLTVRAVGAISRSYDLSGLETAQLDMFRLP
jgi:hypothetical protein